MTTDFMETLLGVNPCFTNFSELKTLQVNLGNFCNLRCRHCHQSASPHGDRVMSRGVMERIAAILTTNHGLILDITGGAPEMHPEFRLFVEMTAGLAKKRILRSNLAVMAEAGYGWLPEFCSRQKLSITASLPCYLEENVARQRGAGTFEKSIQVIRELNGLGYGDQLELDLVYNPGGAFLPPPQSVLEDAYKKELQERYGVRFSKLLTIVNAPLGRFGKELESDGRLDEYMELLRTRFNPETAAAVMCRSLVSIDPGGMVYNCDFNQVLEMGVVRHGKALTVFDFEPSAMNDRQILFGDHCYCCTAGEGSSCSGALTAA